ncbi:MAG: aldolase/citrate lyase family protein [Pigmentiphaga sp.]|uniref:HpcH/HpaI aldolase family protein n=1 Tax=Pigmentiphaga sp. TaxID=1977564 RepID=UPI0029ABAE44|nr:aldolase/citrate lyase family protein [Pigmentiphaga sp.]MDX3906690.1 aldolase/citrate lyase family protein [Pigmentiphaga sp.]
MNLQHSIAPRLRDGSHVYGISVGTPQPALIQMCGYAGYDFVVIDNEHGPASVETVGEAIRAAHGVGLAPIVRTFEQDIPRLLDAGACGIQVPLVETAEQAARMVRACRYPPAGSRSVAFSTPAARYGFGDRGTHIEASNRAVAVILMIETAEAMAHLDDILAVPGVDAVCVGPTDMSYSLGVGGNGNHPKVREAVAECVAACKRAGVAVGANAFSGDECREHVAMGMTYHTMMMTLLLGATLRGGLASMRAAVEA